MGRGLVYVWVQVLPLLEVGMRKGRRMVDCDGWVSESWVIACLMKAFFGGSIDGCVCMDHGFDYYFLSFFA